MKISIPQLAKRSIPDKMKRIGKSCIFFSALFASTFVTIFVGVAADAVPSTALTELRAMVGRIFFEGASELAITTRVGVGIFGVGVAAKVGAGLGVGVDFSVGVGVGVGIGVGVGVGIVTCTICSF